MLYCFKSFSSQVKFKIFQVSPILGKVAVTPFPIPVHLPTNQHLTDASVIHAPTYRWGFGGWPGSTFVVGESATLFPANRNTYADEHIWSIINYTSWTLNSGVFNSTATGIKKTKHLALQFVFITICEIKDFLYCNRILLLQQVTLWNFFPSRYPLINCKFYFCKVGVFSNHTNCQSHVKLQSRVTVCWST